MNLPEQVPGGGAIDTGCLRELARHVDEVGAHPEDCKGHVQGDKWKRNREPSVVDMQRPLYEVDWDNDPLERERQPEHKQEEEQARAGDPQETDGEPSHRRDDKGCGNDRKNNEYARTEELGHFRHVERCHEIDPLRVLGPFESAGHSPRWMQRGHEDADEGQNRERHQ